MLRYVVGLVAVLLIFSSCESDFQLTGDYEEKALVYALLDPNDNPNVGGNGHLFRIQKVFLGEESAFIMALEPDSNYFPYDQLLVELIEYDEGVQQNIWQLDTIHITNKDTGDPDDETIDFFGPVQRLYITPNNANIDPDMDYEVRLTKTGGQADTVIADAITAVVDVESFGWNTPSENSPLAQKMDIFNTSGDYKNYTIRFEPADRGIQYEVWLRFYYREVVQGTETLKTIEWRVNTFELEGTESNWEVQVPAEGVYSRIASELSPEPNVIRKIGRADSDTDNPNWTADGHTQDFDIFMRIGGEELYQYMTINDPNNAGTLVDKPVYTNINNGLGVFSSRSEVEFKDLYLSTTAANQLVDGQYTSGLGFVIDPN